MQPTHHKLINVRPIFFGIEFMHAVVISLAFVFCYLLTHSFLFVFVLCSGLYLVSRVLMAKKPVQWLEDVMTYHLGKKVYLPFDERKEDHDG